MKVRAKFRVDAVKQVFWNPEVKVITMTAVTNDGTPENERFHRYTPSGTLEFMIDNPPVAEAFKLGQTYYLDFSEAPQT